MPTIFCPKCDSANDEAAVFCNTCGKRLIKKPRMSIPPIITILLIVALLGQTVAVAYMGQQLEKRDKRIDNLLAINALEKESQQKYKNYSDKARQQLLFYEDNIVFLADKGQLFHRFGCEHVPVVGEILMKYVAAGRGYTQCEDCKKTLSIDRFWCDMD